jgi:hypothetical protein
MDQNQFDGLIGSILAECSDAHESIAQLYEITHSAEIRDFDWGKRLYDAIWIHLSSTWQTLSQAVSTEEDRSRAQTDEHLVWKTFTILMSFPEFDAELAAKSSQLNGDTVKILFQRLLTAADVANILIAKQCLHWIYRHRNDFRPQLRLQLCTTILKDKGGRGLR